MKIYRKDLTKVIEFNSGGDSLGIDYWIIYQHTENKKYISNCSGCAGMGWEFDRWTLIDTTTDNNSKITSILSSKTSKEQCGLAVQLTGVSCDIPE